MKYIKNYRLFENEEHDFGFLVNAETTASELEKELEEYVDGLYDYGNGDQFVTKCCEILSDSLLSTGKDEAYAEAAYDEFERRFDVDYSTKYNEYDEGVVSGEVKLDGKLVFDYESHADGYGFGGSISNEDHILDVMIQILER